MECLANAFSVLELDAEDDDPMRFASSASNDTPKSSGSDKKVINSDKMLLINEKQSQQSTEMLPKEYKMPLVWIDLEMTGLNVEVDRILEIACIITDGKLTKSVEVIEFVKRNIGTYQPVLAGNSVYVDFLFLKKYMPDLARLFSHVLVDVSSIKALCIRWYPRADNQKAPSKENKHRALDDIRESIRELKYYKDNIFKAFRKK
ncbi:oligoribonuclease isoform X3 [Pyrus x bretschneideri]|uniref:oligoribonuclease isoform X3 n=1 Tax=Pyrus x bretschneideri TaxID=225117 RepID=UPI00202E21E7|nr:oligoribonuclease isoform X3 [Pyrus x bretschneideri]